MSLDHQLLDFLNRFGRVQTLRTGPGAIHDSVAAVQPEGIFQGVQTLAGVFVAAVRDPAISLKQHGRTQIAVTVPPVAGAARGATEAQDAFIEAVELFALFWALEAFPVWRGGRLGLEPRLD